MVKTYSSVLNYFSSTSLAIALSVSSCEIKGVVLLGMMCSNFSVRLCLRTRRKLMLANCLQSRPFSDSDLLIFLANKRLLAETIYLTFLIYLKAIYGQK